MAKSKSHKFHVNGLGILLGGCKGCGYGVTDCECATNYEGPLPEVPVLTFFVDDIKWSLEVFRGNGIGIKLKTVGENVRANVRLTVFSNDPDVPDLTIEKKNEPFGGQFFKIIDDREYDFEESEFINEQAHVWDDDYFSVELFIDVLNRKRKIDCTDFDSNSAPDSDSDSD